MTAARPKPPGYETPSTRVAFTLAPEDADRLERMRAEGGHASASALARSLVVAVLAEDAAVDDAHGPVARP